MRIAIDYDDTYTSDTQLWGIFIDLATTRGHSVAFVTSRSETDHNTDILDDATTLGIPVIFCSHKPKSDCYTADIWIDDTPLSIPSILSMKISSMGI